MIVEKLNLYIKKDNYNTNYNFYNYNKFKLLQIVPITYRSPTIFLDGLYFELPPETRIIEIHKPVGSMTYNLKLEVDLNQNNDIYGLFNCLNNYNMDFFATNKEKFSHRLVKSNKRTSLLPSIEPLGKQPFKSPVKNPLIKNYTYNPFFYITENNKMILTVKIKHNYLFKIFQLLNISDLSKYKNRELLDRLLNQLYREYFELKNEEFNFDLSTIDLFINLWIKANNFIGNEKTELINMEWYICDYKLNH